MYVCVCVTCTGTNRSSAWLVCGLNPPGLSAYSLFIDECQSLNLIEDVLEPNSRANGPEKSRAAQVPRFWVLCRGVCVWAERGLPLLMKQQLPY